MRRVLPLLLVAICTGCQAAQMRDQTVRAAATQTDIEYGEVLNNLAMFQVNPATVPWFSTPNGGTIAVQQTASATGMLNWDYLTFGMLGLFRNHLDKKSLSLTAMQQDNDTFTTAFVTNPDDLQLMRCAYQVACGITDAECLKHLDDFFQHNPRRRQAIQPGWYGAGKLKDVPKNACYVGHYCGSYVWVTESGLDNLAMFTLAILDIATAQPGAMSDPSVAQLKALQDKAAYLAALLKGLPPGTKNAKQVQARLEETLAKLDEALKTQKSMATGPSTTTPTGMYFRPRKPTSAPGVVTPSILP